ncbi:hypothetical protein ATM97_27935 [Nocardia sp. MH4]|uniref:WhiB family transcriptional regulator n=1 Tax=Nocardia sp. MH4 TaxID=1768677 RepID=UPI001C500587|nr:WhiB family transcriptional regulator [Nocardia sp. MH4]MBW0275036.1 hypothetical protein [Nocardia sp. MH4]
MAEIEWRDRAACRNEDPELFFPLRLADAAGAKAICAKKCKVRETCAREAKRTATSHGVHGGYFLPDQKGALRKYVEVLEQRPPRELITSTCESCGNEIHTRVRLVICGSCRVAERGSAVPAAPVREHIEALISQGWTLKQVYVTAGVSQSTASRVACGRVEVVTSTAADKLLKVSGTPPKRLTGVCPVCERDLPASAHSPKTGLRGHCSKKCRDAAAVAVS